jgi:hypothetical protein
MHNSDLTYTGIVNPDSSELSDRRSQNIMKEIILNLDKQTFKLNFEYEFKKIIYFLIHKP